MPSQLRRFRVDESLRTALVQTLFQPMVRGRPDAWRIAAFECLSRGPEGSAIEEAPALFGRMRDLGLEVGIDRACVWRALQAAEAFGLDVPLFINVHAATLHRDREFMHFLATAAGIFGVPLGRLVIEVVEHGRESSGDETAIALRSLAANGIAIAFDDFGANQADARLIRLWSPHFVKLAGNLLSWAQRSSAARQVIVGLVADVGRRGGDVIAEGLEHAGEIALAAELGISLFQGNGVSRPLTPAAAAEKLAVDRISSGAGCGTDLEEPTTPERTNGRERLALR